MSAEMACECRAWAVLDRLTASMYGQILPLSDEIREEIQNARAALAGPCPCDVLRKSMSEVDDVLITNWVGPRKDGDYRQALADLVTQNIREHQSFAQEAERENPRAQLAAFKDPKFAQLMADLRERVDENHQLRVENEQLRAAVVNQAGDNLCWLKEEDLGKIPPKAEFLQSCERYHAQLAAERGELSVGKTIAQLEAECEQLRSELKAAEEAREQYCAESDKFCADAEALRAELDLAKGARDAAIRDTETLLKEAFALRARDAERGAAIVRLQELADARDIDDASALRKLETERDQLRADLAEALDAMRGIKLEADRKTDRFERAAAILAKHEATGGER